MELSNINLFKITDDINNTYTYFGCNQEWYDNIWKKKAGCGPCTVCNIIMYLYYKILFNNSYSVKKSEIRVLMDEIWKYVTPSVKGVNSTKMLFEGAVDYANSKGLYLNYSFLDVPDNKDLRPGLEALIDFITQGIKQDSPVAFLNLCNGKEINLYRWHWVSIIAINVKASDNKVILTVLDEGRIIYINLSLWYETTMLGGGFVYFSK